MPETQHKWIIDGIEEGVARVEVDGHRIISVPTYLLPDDASEGQVLMVSRAASTTGSVQISVNRDPAATAQALDKSTAAMHAAMTDSRKKDPGGNVSL